jgi:hypothetical protein
MDDKQPMQLLRQGRDMSNDPNELPKIMHTCYCGYSLIGAYEYLGGQVGVSRLMVDHLKSVHGVAK